MKSENILRAARNSLLCFFMALGAGFLVACGGGGGGGSVGGGDATPQGGPRGFPVYLSDSAAEGVEYSGPTGNGLTGKGGVFSASEGVFEFSIGETPLGSVRLSRDWANSHVTPADFIDVDEEKVIGIARIMQGLDENPTLAGISISQRARTEVRGDLFDKLTMYGEGEFDVLPLPRAGLVFPLSTRPTYTIPKKMVATDHLVATRKCLFSGGYAGDYRATSGRIDDKGQIYYVVEPFADPAQATGVKFSNVYEFNDDGSLTNDGSPIALSGSASVGAIGSTITLSPGNELSFVTSRLVTGIWEDARLGDAGTSTLTLVEGNPRATRRVVGVEKERNGDRVHGLYILDYFENEGPPSGVFRGRYHNVTNDRDLALTLTIAGGRSWPTDATPTMLTLIETRGGDNRIAITVEVTRNRNDNIHDNRRSVDDNYGRFEGYGIYPRGEISGTWCDISGAVGAATPVPLPRAPRAPSVIKITPTQIDIAWNKVQDARSYKLYRSRSVEGVYKLLDDEPYDVQVAEGFELGYRDRDGPFAGVEFFYRLEACNSSGCSARSPAASSSRLTN